MMINIKKGTNHIGVTVCKEWHNFQNFAEWFDENYYEICGCRMELDKDILYKGNKVYSPKTCVFAPNDINSLFVNNNMRRGKLPIGVKPYNKNNTYQSNIQKYREKIHIGRYNTIDEAFIAYKLEKEKYIREVADKYEYLIPDKLYNAMYKYKIEITD